MFPFPIAKPQGCDIQTFYGSPSPAFNMDMSWNKPIGVSHVYMMLIGPGGTGNGISGGGSGAVTVWYGAAQHVPNNLLIRVSLSSSTIFYRTSLLPVLLRAQPGSSSTGGLADTAGPFAASGFYKSTAGQDGGQGALSPSNTTFLSGGSDAAGITGNYGYVNTGTKSGFFQLQPIIVGVGSANLTGTAGSSGIGCGSNAAGDYPGGPGMVLIASW